MEFFSGNNIHLVIAIILSLINGALLYFIGAKFLHVIQLGGYKISSYKAWIKETKGKYIGRICILCFLSIACMLVTNALLDGYGEFYSYVGLFFYFYFSIIFILNVFRAPQKTPLKQTKRMNRLTAVVYLLNSAITFLLIVLFSEYVSQVKFGIVALTPILTPIIVPISHFICVPMEYLYRRFYLKKAKNKLKKFDNLIKIGITGSFGKTTTKYILNCMLSQKYNVCMSPHSFNTPMGLTKVINSYLKPTHDVLITEMGARQVGDIAYLCNLIEPKHAIITGIGNQHLATFKTVDNIYKAKGELVDSITDGIVCFNAENKGSLKMFNSCEKDKILCGLDDDNYYANITNVKVGKNGSTFDLTIEGKTISCSTVLLGKQNLEDIALSAGLAYKLGVQLQDIQVAISSLKPVPHRMELINENNLTIIDNAYNSSVESSSSALETLKLFDGEKIVVTPGLVELGDEEFVANENLAQLISTVANKVIIVNETNKDALMSGLIKGNFDKNNIYCVDTLNDAKKMLQNIVKSGDVILFENDLPDNYI